ncbi:MULTISPECIES: carbohydrate ABC transporter permease [unclassified Rathayibacter]|uniref:carbohydrate ABC transporter permease n=1 Tax=unclassified Rathayibacter TaxID=2609250 RepID=UPI000CE78B93|nr:MULTISPECIES: sugar ABC transporter permease [unclassified Rathayibacter]PPG08129.1 sugar ABC transporter permease [Rathayibacter sp. AY2B1]PPG68294.1 sugar ABC transporter permease [Rathayibacter sp. AY1F4]PPH51677.1 sugar ABC transporter permease [Rathayibacter sp. AY1E2]
MNSVLADKRAIALLLGPALVVYTAVMLLPMLWSLGYTFFTGGVLGGFSFAGLTNFERLFSDPSVGPAVLFTVKYALLVTVGQVVAGYLLALLYQFFLKRASSLIRTLIFFPVVLPTVAVSLLFQKLFEFAPQTGLVNSVLNSVGIPSVDWLGSADTAFIVIALMDIWRAMGFYGVLLYTGLLDIPDDVIEAASLDGASKGKLIRHVILPLSLPIVVSSAIFSINGTLKVFDSIYALTGGGPGTSTTPLTLYMYRTSFAGGDYGYGATIALLLTVMCLLVTAVIFRGSMTTDKDRA